MCFQVSTRVTLEAACLPTCALLILGMAYFRYPEPSFPSSPLDPMGDAMSWIRGLRSVHLTKQLLAERHGHLQPYLNDAARSIASHSSSALDLLDQAIGGPRWQSFLPLYYAMLHLAKVVAIFAGSLSSVHAQREHGASWTGIHRRSHDLMTDHITLQEKGALALFYRTLTGSPWPSSGQKDRTGKWISTKKRKIDLRFVYPTISSIEYEYAAAYGRPTMLDRLAVEIAHSGTDKNNSNTWRVVAKFEEPVTRKHHLTNGMSRKSDKMTFTTKALRAPTASEARINFRRQIRWHLLHHTLYGGNVTTYTPASANNIQMPQEFSILLVFFHLGNVVRYDPERLSRIVDSKACSMIDAARRHAVLDYMLAIWSFITQRTVLLHR